MVSSVAKPALHFNFTCSCFCSYICTRLISSAWDNRDRDIQRIDVEKKKKAGKEKWTENYKTVFVTPGTLSAPGLSSLQKMELIEPKKSLEEKVS